MSDEITIYHNPRCSKSRQALSLIEEQGFKPKVVLYLDDTPNAKTLKQIIKKLRVKPRELLRTNEAEYKELNLSDNSISDEDIIAAMVAHPKLIERPIIIKGAQAVIGRPPENVNALL